MIAFDRLGPRLRQHLEQAAQVPRAAIGRDPRVDAAAVGDQPDAIAGRLRDVGQRQGGVDGGIELGAIAGARAQQAAAVEHDPHRLAALRAIEARDELAPPRRRRPAHVAPIVAVAIVAQPLELAAGAVLARPPPLGDQRLAAHQVQHVMLRRVEIRVDADRLLDRDARPAGGELPGARVAHRDRPDRRVAALGRRDGVLAARRPRRPGRERHLGHVATERRRRRVGQLRLDHDRRVVLERQRHRRRAAETERTGPLAGDAELRRRRQAPQIQDPEHGDEQIPRHQAGDGPAIDGGGDQPQRADAEQPEGARADAGGDAMGASAGARRRWRRQARSITYFGTSTAATMSETT